MKSYSLVLSLTLVFLTSLAMAVCQETADKLTCDYLSTTLMGRNVFFAKPSVNIQKKSSPVVIFFQGTSTPVQFERQRQDRFGTFFELKTIAKLLDNGYTVIAPRALMNYCWNTNIPPWNLAYEFSPDYFFLKELFAQIHQGTFGDIDENRIYMAGLSSGGYQASRMAITFPEKIKAVAIQSASYATCVGTLCIVGLIPANHPPTVFLHGSADDIVPMSTMFSYARDLQRQNIPVRIWIDANQPHAWSANAPEVILDWFERYK